MAIEINTIVRVGELYGRAVANIALEDAKFFGKPNFAGEMDQFKDKRRRFTVLIPNDVADQLRALGWNVKTSIPTPEEESAGREMVSHLKVAVDDGSDIFLKQGEETEKLSPGGPDGVGNTFGVMDKVRIENMDMEIRAWNYNQEEVKAGIEEPKYSARLVTLVATLRPNMLSEKYGRLG